MVPETVEKNIITKEDIFIKARMISEGVRAQVSKEISPELHKAAIGENKVGDLKIPEELDFNNPESIIELFAEVNKTDTSSDF